MITQEKLKKTLFYDSVTGYFARYYRVIGVWKVIGVNDNPYLQIQVNGKPELAHRVAWLYEYGEWPEKNLDHIDHNPSNNAIENLRQATHQENQRNRSMNNNNTSGYTGVYRNKNTGKWYVNIGINSKNKYLGQFDTISLAILARKSAEIKYNFHENHGD